MEIIHIDDALLVVNKPAGLPVLPDGWEPSAPYLVKLLEDEYGKCWVVHRLDKITSGVLLFARDSDTHRKLNRLFETREVHKTYHAIINGLPGWDEHDARHSLRVNVGHTHRTVVDHRRGKSSQTVFHILERFTKHCLLEAHPLSGRTHQVRVHAYALGFPLLGDILYSAPPTDLIARPALHALSMEFNFEGNLLHFEAPYPLDFSEAIKRPRAG